MSKVLTLLFILSFISSTLALTIDDNAPTFYLKDSRGKDFYLSNYIGNESVKGIILNFFASYCKPCRNELPILNFLVDEYEKRGIKVCGVYVSLPPQPMARILIRMLRS